MRILPQEAPDPSLHGALDASVQASNQACFKVLPCRFNTMLLVLQDDLAVCQSALCQQNLKFKPVSALGWILGYDVKNKLPFLANAECHYSCLFATVKGIALHPYQTYERTRF